MKEKVENVDRETDRQKDKAKKLFDAIAGVTILIVVSCFMVYVFGELIFGRLFHSNGSSYHILCLDNSSAWRYVLDNNLSSYAIWMIVIPIVLMVLGMISCKNFTKAKGIRHSLLFLVPISLLVLCLFIVLTFNLDGFSQRLGGMLLCCVLYVIWMLMFSFTKQSIITVYRIKNKY